MNKLLEPARIRSVCFVSWTPLLPGTKLCLPDMVRNRAGKPLRFAPPPHSGSVRSPGIYATSGMEGKIHDASEGDPSPTVEDWEELIVEYEERHERARNKLEPGREVDRGGKVDETELRPPSGRPLGRENPDQYAQLPVVESAMMTAATAVMWYFGRVLRLDSLIMLFYPLPGFYIMMRWGSYYGNITALTTCMLIPALLGPLYGISYVFNTGLLAFAIGNALWYRWHWLLAILVGAFAKFVGVTAQLVMTSSLLRYNAWVMIGDQVKGIVDGMGGTLYRLLGRGSFPGPSLSQVQFWVLVFLVLHSAFHVTFTHLASTMILDRLYEFGYLKRAPRLIPFLDWLKARVREKSGKLRDHPMHQTKRAGKGDT
jgi:Predicted membrane protein (DUF2232)